MKIVVLRETQLDELRVALMPESVKKLAALWVTIEIERGVGRGAVRSNEDYREAGATVSNDHDALLESADVLAAVNRPSRADFEKLKSGAVVIGFLRPLDEPAELI